MGVLFLNLPNRPRDEEIEVPPLGMLRNGHKYQVEGLKEDLVLGDAEAELPVFELPAEPEVEEVDEEDGEPEPNPLQLEQPVRIEDMAGEKTPRAPAPTSDTQPTEGTRNPVPSPAPPAAATEKKEDA